MQLLLLRTRIVRIYATRTAVITVAFCSSNRHCITQAAGKPPPSRQQAHSYVHSPPRDLSVGELLPIIRGGVVVGKT
jgi:hypothetical protein